MLYIYIYIYIFKGIYLCFLNFVVNNINKSIVDIKGKRSSFQFITNLYSERKNQHQWSEMLMIWI